MKNLLLICFLVFAAASFNSCEFTDIKVEAQIYEFDEMRFRILLAENDQRNEAWRSQVIAMLNDAKTDRANLAAAIVALRDYFGDKISDLKDILTLIRADQQLTLEVLNGVSDDLKGLETSTKEGFEKVQTKFTELLILAYGNVKDLNDIKTFQQTLAAKIDKGNEILVALAASFSAFRELYTANTAAAAALWADMYKNILQTSANTTTALEILRRLEANLAQVLANQLSIIQKIDAGFAKADAFYAEVKLLFEKQGIELGKILANQAILLTQLTEFRSSYNANHQNIVELLNLISLAIRNSETKVLAAIGDLKAFCQSILTNILVVSNDVKHAIALITSWRDCARSCGLQPQVIINNTIINNVTVRTACCGMGMPPMNGCD